MFQSGCESESVIHVRFESLKEEKQKTHFDESFSFRLVKVVERLHIVIVELDDLQVVDDTFLRNRFRENDDLSLNYRRNRSD